MGSSSIDNCARVSETVPLAACGRTKRPRSNRLANKHNPSPSYQRTLIRSPLRPRNTKTCPENGFSSSLLSTSALSPVKPRRKSVTPAAIQTRVFVGGPIIPQALQQHPHQCRIGIAFDPHLRLPQFDVNRARLWFREIGGPMLHRQRLRQTFAHSNRQQLDGRLAFPKPSCPATSETCREVSIQIALLRVLQEREIERVGSDKPIPLDVRVLAATNRDLHNLVREGKFRQDLAYRLNVVPIEVPSLRERAADIPIAGRIFHCSVWKEDGEALQNYRDEWSTRFNSRMETGYRQSFGTTCKTGDNRDVPGQTGEESWQLQR